MYSLYGVDKGHRNRARVEQQILFNVNEVLVNTKARGSV